MYALKTWESPVKTMLEKYKEHLTEDGVFIMTAAEQLKQQGIQIGFDQGIEKGAFKKARETANNMILRGYNENDIAELTGLEKSVIEELKKVASKQTQH